MNGTRREVTQPAVAQPTVLSFDELVDQGHTRTTIRAGVASGELVNVRRGWYWRRPPPDPRSPAPPAALRSHDLYRAGLVAALRSLATRGREPVLTGPAAALWWGLPWVGRVPSRVTVAGDLRSGRADTDLLQRTGVVAPDDVVRHDGALVTRAALAVVDASRLCDSRSGLVLADAALHVGLVQPEELAADVARQAGRRGIGRARWCVRHADALAESPGESVSRHAMIRAGLPLPELQRTFVLPGGQEARPDFHWPRTITSGEFDGLGKYRGEFGLSPEATLIAEKLREDGLRALGHRVLRWTWQDVWQPAAWLARLRAALL